MYQNVGLNKSSYQLLFLPTKNHLIIPRFKDKKMIVREKEENTNKEILQTNYLNDVVTSIPQAKLDGYSRDTIRAT